MSEASANLSRNKEEEQENERSFRQWRPISTDGTIRMECLSK